MILWTFNSTVAALLENLPCFSGDVILDITARIIGMEHIPTEPINAPGNITIALVSVSAYLNAEHMYKNCKRDRRQSSKLSFKIE